MKVAIFASLFFAVSIANATPHYDETLPEFEYHKVTGDDCRMIADISKGAVEARKEGADMDAVVLGLMKPELLTDVGYRAMMPMAIINVNKIFNAPATIDADLAYNDDLANCSLYSGFDMPYQK